ncbi:MAG: hypothetical protein LQ337_001624 [Flavoplaca oasis]|nr:MAG: hypothetical protein LQ337_001624 [Flavoplaca oasis]
MATNVDAKLLKQTKFPPEFSQKVDMKKVNVEVMKKWIAGKISEILGSEDDVVVELCFNLLEGSRFPDIKVLQIQLTGFLDKDTPKFCKELWTLCLSAQSNPQGVPKELLEAKKLELIQEKIDAEKAAEEAQRRKDQERMRDKNIDSIRQRERTERGRGRGRADPYRLPAAVMGETEGRELISVAVIELDPIHLQIRLAHDHPEDHEGQTTLRYHPAVLRLHRSYAIDKATIMVRAGVAAAIGVCTQSARRRQMLQREFPAYRGSGKEKGGVRSRDMHPPQEDGVTPLQFLHPLRSDTRQLILLEKKRTDHPPKPCAEALTANLLL